MRKTFYLLPLLLFSIATSQPRILPDKTQERYSRKSISFINRIVLLNSIGSLTPAQQDYFIKVLRASVELARFDYNPLPEGIISSLNQRLNNRVSLRPEELRGALESTVVPEVVRIVDLQKEFRARKLVTEAQRNTFLATKARDYGVLASQLEQVMNSAFLYVPFIVVYDARDNGGSYEVRITGGVMWYQVLYTNGEATLKYIDPTIRSSFGHAMTGGNVNYIDGENVPPREYAYRSAVKNLFENVSVEVRNKIADLQAMERILAEARRGCHAGQRPSCPAHRRVVG